MVCSTQKIKWKMKIICKILILFQLFSCGNSESKGFYSKCEKENLNGLKNKILKHYDIRIDSIIENELSKNYGRGYRLMKKEVFFRATLDINNDNIPYVDTNQFFVFTAVKFNKKGIFKRLMIISKKYELKTNLEL